MAEPNVACGYCGSERPVSEMVTRDVGVVCRDGDACQEAEDQAHHEYLAELRKRRSEGDELTDAEKGELSDA